MSAKDLANLLDGPIKEQTPSGFEDTEEEGTEADGYDPTPWEADDHTPIKTEEKEAEEKKETVAEKTEEKQESKAEDRKGPVPYQRFEEVTRQNQALRREQKEHAEKMARLEGRFDQILKVNEKPPPPPPDPMEDPEGFKTYHETKSQQALQYADEAKRFQADTEGFNTEIQRAQQEELQFASTAPDYYEVTARAKVNAIEGRAQAYINTYGVEPAVAREQATQDYNQWVGSEYQRARQINGNWAKAIYGYAKEAIANREKTAKPATDKETKTAVNVEEAKRKNRSAATAGAGAVKEPTIDDIDNMTEAEFDDFMKKHTQRNNPLRG